MINFLNLIYPNVCGFCNKIIFNGNICNKCYIKIKSMQNLYKLNCKGKYFDNGYSIFKYEGLIRNKIIDYKFNNKAYLYKSFGEILIKNKKIYGILKKYDIIIPVPISKKRKLKRGYNQTELIAGFLSKNMKIQYERKALIKTKNIISQSQLTKKQRIKNVQGAFKIKNINKIKNKKILLLDDIYTTGSTANECSKILKEAKANNICILTIAKD